MKDSIRFLSKIRASTPASSAFMKTYARLLPDLWSHKLESLLSELAKSIETHLEDPHIFALYRLWIEVLQRKQDVLSLNALKQHLAKLAALHENYDTWTALRGLIHFELDEMDACSLLLKSVQGNRRDPYVLELEQRYRLRLSSEEKPNLILLEADTELFDYVVLESLARTLLASQHIETLVPYLEAVNQIYPQSPLKDEFLFWKSFEENKLSQSISHGESLVQRFPRNLQYKFHLAYAWLCHQNLNKGREILEDLYTHHGQKDPDTLSLLGYTYIQQAKDTRSPEWKKAIDYLSLAKIHAEKAGIPSSEILLSLTYLQASPKLSSTQAQYWSVSLSPRREYELLQSEERDVDYLFYALNAEVKKGDVVFFTRADKKDAQILAAYHVIANDTQNPRVKDECILEQISRFPKPIYVQEPMPSSFHIWKLEKTEVQKWIAQLPEETKLKLASSDKVSLGKNPWKGKTLRAG